VIGNAMDDYESGFDAKPKTVTMSEIRQDDSNSPAAA
jgi:hypothetical protein